MTTRRDFMQQTAGAAAGIAFTGCGLLDAAPAHAQGGKRREVVVAGRRVKTVDVHAHCVIPEAMSLMGMKIAPQALVVVQDRLRIMDQQGIDVEALSINPFWYGAERDKAAELIKLQNEKLAEICAANPDRFVAFASLALQYPDLAVQQLEYAVKKDKRMYDLATSAFSDAEVLFVHGEEMRRRIETIMPEVEEAERKFSTLPLGVHTWQFEPVPRERRISS